MSNTEQIAEVILKVNNQEAIDKFNELEKKAKDLRQKFAEAFKSGDPRAVKEINGELTKVNREMARMQLNASNIRAAMKRLNEATPRELQQTIKNINAELNSGRVPRGTKQWEYYTNQLKLAQAELRKVRREMEETEGLFTRMNRKINDWGTSIAAGAAAMTGIVLSGKSAVKAYADMQAEEANVRKFTGMTEEQVKKLNDEFKKMDTRTSREELNKLAQEAGRLGKTSEKDVLGFVRAANQINVALDEIGKGATLELSKLTDIFGDEKRLGTERALLAVGSVINDLSQNCTAGAAYMVDYAKRMAGVGAQAKMTIPQIMSYAAVLDSQGQNVEASATAMSQLIMKMYQDPAKIAKAAGMKVKAFSEILKKDANAALIELLKTLNSYGGLDALATIFDDMGTDGARASTIISALAGSVGMLVWEQGEANKAFREATSVTNEYTVQNTTAQAKLDKAMKGFTERAVTLGQKLMPVMSNCISGTSMLMRVLLVLVDFVTANSKALVTLTVAVGAYWVSVKTATMWQKIYNTAISIYNTTISTSIFKTKAFCAVETLCAGGLALLNRNTKRASAAWRIFNATVKANPIGLVVSALATGITILSSWILKNREAVDEERRIASERRTRMNEFQSSLTSIGEAASKSASKESGKLKELYNAATNIYKSSKKREEAAKALQELYPNTFSNLTTEKIMTGLAADAYLRLAKNIKEVARAEAARDKMKENYQTQLSIELENDDLADSLEEKVKKLDALEKRISGLRSAAAGNSEKAQELRIAKAAHAKLFEEVTAIDELMAENRDKVRMVDKANAKLQNIADSTVKAIEKTPEPEINKIRGESEKERKAREKAEREAKKKQREEEAEARKLLKEHIDSVKAIRIKEETANLATYTSGQKNYLQYVETKDAIERRYLDDSIKVLEEHGKKDTKIYEEQLNKREQLEARAADRRRNATLHDIEREHKKNEDDAVSDFYDPDSPIFQNQKALNQRLLEEDIRYLREKLKLYSEGSEEWVKINDEMEDRVARDQQDKQRETAEAIEQFRDQFSKDGAYRRMLLELDMLDLLHEKGLIKEKEYQQARSELMASFREEGAGEMFTQLDQAFSKAVGLIGGKLPRIEMEITKSLSKLTPAELSDFFENFEKGFDNFFGQTAREGFDAFLSGFEAVKELSAGNIKEFISGVADMAQNAANIIGGVMGQFSSYWDATMNLEIAKVEKRYDREIEAAGSNSKKRKALEEKREKEVAAIKTRYNNRAMKLEIAQAIAQTAANALGAYGAMAKIPVVGPALAAAAAAMATAAGMIQVATIKKQHQAEAQGYYSGGFTMRDPNDRKEVGVVHANEFVANHQAVASPVLSPVLNLIDHAQRTNTVGSLTAEDVSNALGTGVGVSARGERQLPQTDRDKAIAESMAALTAVSAKNSDAIDRLSRQIEEGLMAQVIMDGEQGLYRKLSHFEKLRNNPKR